MRMKTTFGECGFCGGKVIERRMAVNLEFGGRLQRFENVPIGRCTECGERVLKASVAKQLERLARSRSSVKRRISVPVRDYVPA